MAGYIALLVAFLMTLVGIIGDTWNRRAKGYRRLTMTGWAVVVLAAASLALGISELREKDAEIRDIRQIRRVANRQVLDGVSYLLRHLEPPREGDDKALFSTIEDPVHLAKLGRTCLVSASGRQVSDGFGGVGGAFEQPWQLVAFDVRHGKDLLDDTIIKYGGFVEPGLLVRINDVLSDNFFLTKFSLAPDKLWLDLALGETKTGSECSGYGALGLYYFNAVYVEGRERAPEYSPFLAWLEKVRALVEFADDHGRFRVFGDGAAKQG